MFDFRYHVASLAAVFVALIIGILVGVGLSGQGFVTDSERERLERRIDEPSRPRTTPSARGPTRSSAASRQVRSSPRTRIPCWRRTGCAGRRSLSSSSDHSAIPTPWSRPGTAVGDAGGRVVRTYALRVPLEAAAVQEALRRRPELAGYAGRDHLGDLGRDVGRELVEQGPTPLLDALADEIVEERLGSSDIGADGVVVVRSAPPQMGATADFVNGLYGGVASAGVPAVGAETSEAVPSAVPAFARSRLSTVDDVDAPSGRLALVLLLAGAEPGNYGRRQNTATDGILPPIEPLPDETGDGGG